MTAAVKSDRSPVSTLQGRNNLDLIIKLGGAAITEKDKLETAKLDDIKTAAKLVKKLNDNNVNCVIVHGAGSFGHHQAAEYGVNKRGIPGKGLSHLREGFCKTRVSVTKLNHIVTECLVQEGVPAVGMQACGFWRTYSKKVITDGVEAIDDLLTNGYVPILHGDCVIDNSQHCCVLSGDTIIKRLCEVYSPKKVVFLTDVDGVFDKPPQQPGANLLPVISVNSEGVVNLPIVTSTMENDVTGGMVLKLDSAVNIVIKSEGRIPVIICNISGSAVEQVCLHDTRPLNATFIEYKE